MEQYYSQQAVLPRFTGHATQRSGFGSLAAGVGTVAVPFAKKFYSLQSNRSEKNYLFKVYQNWLKSQQNESLSNKLSNQQYAKQLKSKWADQRRKTQTSH